jgi:hypothetical protein
MPRIDKFAAANLTARQDQMKKIGLNDQANRLEKAKKHLSGAYDLPMASTRLGFTSFSCRTRENRGLDFCS